ncbi:MAG TPA: TolC family protein [Verrucomicrobiae bacterium]|nr:TolC family protein [Verrucomicrobiae bacterium]
MASKRILCLLLACGAALLANAQTTNTNQPQSTGQTPAPAQAASTNLSPEALEPPHLRKTRLMSLDECIKLALEHNLDIQIQEYNPIVNQFLLNFNYGSWEPSLDFTANKRYTDSTGGLNPQTQNPYPPSISEVDTFVPELKGVTPWGLQYDASFNVQRVSEMGFSSTNNFPPFHYLPPDFPATVGVQLTQPLLKNFWIDNTRLQIQLSKATLKESEAALRLQVMTSVTAVKSAYFNLLYGRDNVKAQATAYQLAEQLVNENLKRVQVGALAPLDEKQSESQAAASLALLHQAEYQLQTFENTLKGLIADNYSQWSDVSIIPAEELVAVPQELNLQESWRKAVAQRPELIEAKLKVQAQNVQLKYDLNQIFPELDIVGSYARNATDATFDQDLTTLRHGNFSTYTYGAFVSIPLGGNMAARSQYKSGKATLKQLLLALKQTEQNIIIAVDNDVGNVQSQFQQVQATRDARIYAQEALDAERKKLENGKSTSFVVLQLISNLTSARVAEIQALANYNIALSQLALDEGSTLEANHIQLKLK